MKNNRFSQKTIIGFALSIFCVTLLFGAGYKISQLVISESNISEKVVEKSSDENEHNEAATPLENVSFNGNIKLSSLPLGINLNLDNLRLNAGIDLTDVAVAIDFNSENSTFFSDINLDFYSNNFDIDLKLGLILDALSLLKEEDMNTEVISNADVNNIRVESTGSAIFIEPTADEDIKLMYSPQSDFHVRSEVSDGVLSIQAKAGIIKNYTQSDCVLKIYIPQNLIGQLNLVSSAAFVHVAGKDNLFQSCNIDVSVGALYLENIYADTTVKTITGAIKLKNDTIKSNIRLETQVGVVDIALRKLPDNVSINTSGTVKRNTFLRTRNAVSSNEQYVVEAKSRLGVINIH